MTRVSKRHGSQNGTSRRPEKLGASAGDNVCFQLLDSELSEQQSLRRFEILEGDRFVIEALVQRSEIGEHIILRTLRGQSRLCFLS